MASVYRKVSGFPCKLEAYSGNLNFSKSDDI